MSDWRFSLNLLNSFFVSFIHSTFLLCSLSISPRTVLLPLHPVVHLSSCFLRLLIGRIFFHYFGKSCFAYIGWFCPSIFRFSFLSPIFFDFFLSVVMLVLPLVEFFWSFNFIVLVYIFPSSILLLVQVISFFVLPSSNPAFVCLFGFLGGMPILSLTCFAPA